MSARLFAAMTLAAITFAGAPPSSAADLDDDIYGSGYDDRRYAERYSYDRDDVIDDDDYGPPRRERYSYREESRYDRTEPGYGCASRHEIRSRLRADGWNDIQGLGHGGDVAHVSARRPSGEPYDLKIDRCSGEIVDARPLNGHGYGPYAYGPRRYGPRPY